MKHVTYAVLHQVGFILSRPSGMIGIPYGTGTIADVAVVSYTTFSPFPRAFLRTREDVYFL